MTSNSAIQPLSSAVIMPTPPQSRGTRTNLKDSEFLEDLTDNSHTPDNTLSENDIDVQLMQRIATGDEEAFKTLIERHQGAVIGTVAKMLGCTSDSEDIAQQVFIRLWKSAPRYKPSAKFTTYLFTITRNLVFNESRRRSRKKEYSIDEREDDFHLQTVDQQQTSPDDGLLHAELQTKIDQAIQDLPEKQRLALILRRYEGMPYDEIARIIGLSVSAVKSQLFRARNTLRESLKDYLDQ